MRAPSSFSSLTMARPGRRADGEIHERQQASGVHAALTRVQKSGEIVRGGDELDRFLSKESFDDSRHWRLGRRVELDVVRPEAC